MTVQSWKGLGFTARQLSLLIVDNISLRVRRACMHAYSYVLIMEGSQYDKITKLTTVRVSVSPVKWKFRILCESEIYGILEFCKKYHF